MKRWIMLLASMAVIVGLGGCTQETQNKMGRGLQNWTGVNGVVDVFNGGKLMMRFIKVDKLTTGKGTDDSGIRPYRYGYGYLDENQNYKVDPGEKKLYFEVSDYATQYVFYENPRG